MLQKEKNRNIFTIVWICILTAIPVSLCFNRSVWLDEAFSLRWSMWPFPDFLQRIQLDVCPLYLITLRIVLTLTNNSLLAAKLFSVLAVFLLFLVGAFFVEKNFGCKAMIFYDLFLLFAPMMLKKSVEVRTYTWAYFWVTASCVEMYFLLKGSTEVKRWVLFTLFSLAAAYSHYFAVLTLVIVYAGMLLFFLATRNVRQIKAWLLCSLATILGYLPWLPVIFRQTNSETTSWIPESTSRLGILRDMFTTDRSYGANIYIILMIAFLVFGFVLFCKYRTAEFYWSCLCMSLMWGVLFMGLVFEKLSRPILVDRYLMIPFCASVLGISYLCRYLPKYLLMLPCAFFLFVGAGGYQKVYQEEYDTLTDKTLQFAEEHIEEGAIILYDSENLSSVIPYYFPELSEEAPDIYEGDYKALWYFDVENSLEPERLEAAGIYCLSYGEYGFDNVNFTIYYVYRES